MSEQADDKRLPINGDAAPPAPTLGQRLKIRTTVHMAGEVLPFFWPMRSFIHHNPLHGLEHLPFDEAVALASRLFHARGFLPRADYQRFLRDGDIDPAVIETLIERFLADWRARQDPPPDDAEIAELEQVLLTLMTRMDQPTPGGGYPSTALIVDCLLQLLSAPEDDRR
jgi:hypothetical protein